MGIVFFCQSCGARFEVGAAMAGKTGRCRKCGQAMSIPRAEHLASMTAMPAVKADAAGGVAVAAPPRAPAVAVARVSARPDGTSTEGPGIGDWLRQAVSSVGLAPLTMDGAPAIGFRRGSAPSPLDDDLGDSKPYLLAGPAVGPAAKGKAASAAGAAVQLWRREIGLLQRVFRWFSESAYFLSVPFIVALLVGAAIKNRPLALFAATIVVLLNVGRVVAGVGNLVLVPLREGIHTGRKLKKPVRRVVEPVVTIALVFLGFTFIPWLAPEGAKSGTVADRLRQGAGSLRKEMKGGLKDAAEQAKTLDVDQLGDRVRKAGETVKEKLKDSQN